MDTPLEFCVKNHPDTRYTDRNFSSYILMQFTGLTDKNGKEIYEGDIVRTTGWPDGDPVYWVDGRFCVGQPSNLADFLGSIAEGCEIIGNIYENPELLKS